MKRSDVAFVVVLVPLDYLILVGSFMLAYYVRRHYLGAVPEFLQGPVGDVLSYSREVKLLSYQAYVDFILYISFMMTAVFALTGLYKMRRFTTSAQRSSQIFRSVMIAFFAFVTVTFALGNTVLPRLVIIYAFIFAIVGLFLGRFFISLIRTLLQRFGVGIVRVGIVGAGTNANRARVFLGNKKKSGYRLSKQFDGSEGRAIERAIKSDQLDELMVADKVSADDVLRWRELCVQHRVGFMFIPSVLEVVTTHVTVRDIRGLPVIEVPVTQLEGWGFVVKRFIDVIGSAVLIVLLSPIYLLLALLIYLDNPGPVFYRHERLGRNMKPFALYKFRTMKQEFCDGPGADGKEARRRFAALLKSDPKLQEEWNKYQKLKRDPRVTRLGGFLRRSSLDEIPQFINVLKGDISLVGPRPIVASELEKYGQSQYRLAAIKPGLTGLWQVSGRNDTTYEERVKLDMIYVETWSLWLDITILWRTIFTLIFRSGAY